MATRPRPLLHSAIRSSSLSDLQSALTLAKNQSSSTYPTFLRQALTTTVRAGSVPLTVYLLDTAHAPLFELTPGAISLHPSIALFETLVTRGFDINATGASNAVGKSERLIDQVIGDEELVTWLLQHGSRVDSGDAFVGGDGYEVEPRPAPLTESCAARGSVATFKRILQEGARVGKRTLHKAAENAAAAGAFNDRAGEREDVGGIDEGRKWEREMREEMIRFLVEEQGFNVNESDSNMARAMHWGTPISYAAQKREGIGVVRYLLERGADPSIQGADGADAYGNAKVSGSEKIMGVLAEWQDRHK
ncbi:MAG: hypothetical protein M1822_008024 [Bathelium mastoideum]|nr:MAG: hypothetical protein M1822_008024 [Bathelium mastoideum]